MATLLASAALLSACARFAAREISVARSATAFDRRSLDSPDLHAFVQKHGQRAPRGGAWSFEALALAAYYFHPSLDVARAELDSAHAAEITAGARPNPTVGFSPSLNASSAGVSPWIAALDFDLPIETAGKRGLRLIAARHRTEAARLRLTSAAWKVRANLRAALLDLADASERTSLIARQLAKQEEGLGAMQQKLAAGAIPGRELSVPRTALVRLKKEREDARVLAAESRARVATALGMPVRALPAGLAARADVAGAEALATREARRRALTSRADLLASLADYAAAQAALRLEVAKQFPDVHLGPGYEFDQGENKWALGLSVELPVFNRNQGPIAEADAKRREAAARVLALQASIAGEVEQAAARWQGAKQRLGALSELVAEQQRQSDLATASLNAGAGERLDVLIAEGELAGAELLRWDATVQAARAFAELEAAVQRPLRLDLTVSPRPEEP